MDKSYVIIACLLIAILPWMSGGRDALAVVITVFSLLIAGFLTIRSQTAPKSISTWPLRLVVTAWLGWGTLSLLWSANRFQTEQWLLYVLIAVTVFMIAAKLSLVQKRQVLRGYLWIAVVTAIYGLYLYITGEYGRLTSSFYWANPAAAFLLPAFIMSGWHFIAKKHWLIAMQTLIIGTAFWLTDSRGALLVAAAVVVGGVAIPAVRRRLGWIAVIIAVTFVCSFGLAQLKAQVTDQAAPAPGSRFSEAASGESISVQDRLFYLKSAGEIWKDHPLLGTGAGTYGTIHPQYQERVISASNNPHSILAAALAEQGLMGLLILLYLAILLAWGVIRGVRRQPELAAAAIAGVALALHFMMEANDRYPALIVLLALLIGVTYQPWRHVTVPGWRKVVLPASLVAVLALGLSTYLSDTRLQHGRIHDDNHNLALAAESYARAHSGLVYNPDAWTAEGIDYYTIAALTGGSKRYIPLARDRAKQAILRDPHDSQHYFLLGRVERLAGRPTEAITAYRQALALDRLNHPEYYADLAAVLMQQGKTTEARAVVAKGLSLYPEAVIRNRSSDKRIKPAVAELRRLQAALSAV